MTQTYDAIIIGAGVMGASGMPDPEFWLSTWDM